MPILILLVPIGIAMITGVWVIGGAIMALCRLVEGQFFRAAFWASSSIFSLDIVAVLFLDEQWANFTPIYVFLFGVAACLHIVKYFAKRKLSEEPEILTLSDNVIPFRR